MFFFSLFVEQYWSTFNNSVKFKLLLQKNSTNILIKYINVEFATLINNNYVSLYNQ